MSPARVSSPPPSDEPSPQDPSPQDPSPRGGSGGGRVVGLLADPGTPWALVQRVADDLDDHVARRLSGTGEWRVEVLEHTLAVSPVSHMVLEDPVRDLADRHGWDTVVAVVDLPRFDEGRGVVGDLAPELSLAVVCVPALGVIAPARRLRETLVRGDRPAP